MKMSHRPIVERHVYAAAVTVIGALSLAAAASASGITGPDVTVRYADLDVDTVDGATLLLKRIESASGRVCSPLDHGDLASRGRREACEQKLIAAAVSRVNSPALATVYQSVRRDAPRVIAQAK